MSTPRRRWWLRAVGAGEHDSATPAPPPNRVRVHGAKSVCEPAEDQFGLGILEIIACPPGQTIAKAKTWLQRVQKTKRPAVNRRALVELIEVVVQSRFPKLGRKELERMLGLTDIRETKVFQEALEEGMEKGMEMALEQVAIRSLAKGHSVADVVELTGLAVAHVKRLKKKSNSKA